MTEATQPRMARGTMLTAGILAAALFALLAFAPVASAASDPVASGTTTLTLNGGFTNKLKKNDIKLTKISPATLKGKKATFTVTGGELDPLTGLGTATLGGGLKFKAGKKTATVKALTLDTTKKSLSGKVAGKQMKVASIKSFTFVRNGFGVNLTLKTLKLTSSAAKQLNKKLGFTGGKSKSSKRAGASKAEPLPFKGNQVLGNATSETQPSTVVVNPGGNLTFAANETTIGKLKDVEVGIETISPTATAGTEKAPIFSFPITGGTVGPTATAGVIQSSGGLKLVQKLTEGPSTTITLGAFYVDLAAKTVSVEVIAESNAEVEGKKPLNLGNLGRSSIADLTLTGATVTADPTTRTVSVQNAAATLQPVSAEVLEGFVKVYQGYYQRVLELKFLMPEPLAKEEAAKKVANDHITAGTPLGTFSFTAQGQ